MSLRILHVTAASQASPFLSSEAANAAWLPPALEARGHHVAVTSAAELSRATDQRPDGFDIVHLHTGTAADLPKHGIVAPTLISLYQPGAPVRAPWVALSYRQAQRQATLPAAVIAPAIDTSAIPLSLERGDGLAFAFDGHDTAALQAAITVARRTERPLVVLTVSASLSPECSHLINRARNVAQSVAADSNWAPGQLAGAACYLSFQADQFDMAAITAQAAGLPVVTFEDLPAAEAIVHGETGFVVRSIDEACRAADRLSLLAPGGARSRTRLLFDADSAAMRYEALYEQLVRGERPVFRHPELDSIRPARTLTSGAASAADRAA